MQAKNLEAMKKQQLSYNQQIEHLRIKKPANHQAEAKIIRSTLSLINAKVKEDENQRALRIAELDQYLVRALQCYFECLQYSSRHDVRAVARLVTLWFDADELHVNKIVCDHLDQVPSHKFLPLLPQIVSRLGSGSSSFQSTINRLVSKVGQQHIYHAVLPLLALKNGGTAKKAGGQGSLVTGSAAAWTIDQGKGKTASELLEKLQSGSKQLSDVVQQTELVVSGYIELAEKVVKRGESQKNQPITKMLRNASKNCPQVAVVSASFRHDSAHVPKLKSFHPSFDMAACGINVPKVIKCMGDDGIWYKQLVKLDETRQDAVMQQLYSMVNMLLQEDDDTRKRQLRLRTYEIKPLSPCCGVLEWCQDTMPLMQWLKTAHTRLHPGDWTPTAAFKKMETALQQNEAKVLLKCYQDIAAHLKPVFHRYFAERYPDSYEWFHCRQNYTRSVASNSMVGYILGLGDRHLNNILIDTTNGELVHIDFGITFEMGKILPTPERVPFRLTRDIVDGMGIAGTEGTFKRCCEATLSVLRSGSELLLAMAEVLRHDPLQRWALDPAAINKQLNVELPAMADQAEEEQDRQVVAKNVLLKLQERLQGIEQGLSLIHISEPTRPY
eukprot:TRINITY_DN12582_c0_g1_i1.p1 TRINITY_DN12582_c0_g1~~TRINITY_DN12582_c0_g1_i1.p1  ORF type:complete len:612 (-),score=186.60 TRINITY_DN12582_c0_g1_i1:71-1906(-)